MHSYLNHKNIYAISYTYCISVNIIPATSVSQCYIQLFVSIIYTHTFLYCYIIYDAFVLLFYQRNFCLFIVLFFHAVISFTFF